MDHVRSPKGLPAEALARPSGTQAVDEVRQGLVDEVRKICVKGGGSVPVTWVLSELPQDPTASTFTVATLALWVRC